MIQLKKLFTPVEAMDGEKARQFLQEQKEGAYTLLDVRQPWEYEEDHIPGAKLIPLAELKDAVTELDSARPTLVYCAVGGRSRVAAQLLSGMGFKEVYNLSGGIKGYQGTKATGPEELNLDLVRGDESPAEMLELAYGMEKALGLFYDAMAGKTQDQEVLGLLGKLGQIEEKHKNRIFARYQAVQPGGRDQAALEAEVTADIVEGGFKLTELLTKNDAVLKSLGALLELAMMLETQALDLYLRLARKSIDQETREVLFAIAEEEKAHVAALGRLMDQKH